jgi:hypothetical protein
MDCTSWTGTHGEMISSDLHGDEEPIRWLLGPRQGQIHDNDWMSPLDMRRRRTFHPGHFG